MYQCLDKGHLLPGVFHDDNGILRGTAEKVGGKHHGEVTGVHFGDANNIWADKDLEEPYQKCQDILMKFWKLLNKRICQLCILSNPNSFSIQVVIWNSKIIKLCLGWIKLFSFCMPCPQLLFNLSMISCHGTSISCYIRTWGWAWHYIPLCSTDRVWGGCRAPWATAWAGRRARGRHCRCRAPTGHSDTWHSSPRHSQPGSGRCPLSPGRSWLKEENSLRFFFLKKTE